VFPKHTEEEEEEEEEEEDYVKNILTILGRCEPRSYWR